MSRYSAVWPVYAAQWDAMVINPNRRAEFVQLAEYALLHKAEYLEVERATGVPWPMVAVINRREGGGDFGTYLGNGQSLRAVTTIVPRGRGPFSSFLAGAIDALRVDDLTNVIDWRLEKQLFWCTSFNGWPTVYGYRSPYIWGGTSIQVAGKYVSDGNYDPHVWDTQPGCAPMLAEIANLDHTVKFIRETPMGIEPPMTTTPAPLPPTPENKQNTPPHPQSTLEQWFTPPPTTTPVPMPGAPPPTQPKTVLTPHQVATIRSGVHNLINRDINTVIKGVVPAMFQASATSYISEIVTNCTNDVTTFIEDQFK